MKTATQQKSSSTSLILGILYLAVGIVQIALSAYYFIDMGSEAIRFAVPESVCIAFTLVPALLMLAYIVSRIHVETGRAGKTALIAAGYIALGVVWYLIFMLIANIGALAAIYAYVSIGTCALASLGFAVAGPMLKRSRMTLTSVMCCNWLYLLVLAFYYGMSDQNILSTAAAGGIAAIPLFIFMIVDLVLLRRAASNRTAAVNAA